MSGRRDLTRRRMLFPRHHFPLNFFWEAVKAAGVNSAAMSQLEVPPGMEGIIAKTAKLKSWVEILPQYLSTHQSGPGLEYVCSRSQRWRAVLKGEAQCVTWLNALVWRRSTETTLFLCQWGRLRILGQ